MGIVKRRSGAALGSLFTWTPKAWRLRTAPIDFVKLRCRSEVSEGVFRPDGCTYANTAELERRSIEWSGLFHEESHWGEHDPDGRSPTTIMVPLWQHGQRLRSMPVISRVPSLWLIGWGFKGKPDRVAEASVDLSPFLTGQAQDGVNSTP